MAILQRARLRPALRRLGPSDSQEQPIRPRSVSALRRPLTSPGQIAVIYRWAAWALALGLIVTGTTATFGTQWAHESDVYLLLGVTLAMNLAVTLGLRPYMRLMRRYPAVLVVDVLICLAIYARSDIWTSPFQFYSYSALMLPVVIFYFSGALAGSLLFLPLNLVLLYRAGDSFGWAQAHGFADTYLMQLAIVPLLAFVFAYPNRLYAQLRLARQRLDLVEREQLLVGERTRIAQSLHDSVAQMLFGIGMLAESALVRLTELDGSGDRAAARGESLESRAPLTDVLRQVRDLATRGNHEMRRAIYALNEPGPSRRGLGVSLRAMLADVAGRTGCQTHFVVVGAPLGAQVADTANRPAVADALAAPPATPLESDAGSGGASALALPAEDAPDVETSEQSGDLMLPEPLAQALYKVAREALANVEKHAGATQVWVELRSTPAPALGGSGHVELVVRDDGCGFRRPLLAQPGEPDEDEFGHLHFGLGNMRRAIESVGGRLEVTTAPGRGTKVRASAPVP